MDGVFFHHARSNDVPFFIRLHTVAVDETEILLVDRNVAYQNGDVVRQIEVILVQKA
jgi:hypothetical protein